MSMSHSERKPGRLFFKCSKRKCDFFQWVNEHPRGKNKTWLKGNTNPLDPELYWEKNKEEYAGHILCQTSRQAIARQKDLERLKGREETGLFEGNWDSENLVKNQRGMVG